MTDPPLSNPIGTPQSDVHINAELVRTLLYDQHPDLANLPLQLIDEGWDNVMFRLGSTRSVRLPRRQVASTLIKHEQTWLPLLAEQLPIPVPTPYRVGMPAHGYPWQWSVLPWFSGVSADLNEPSSNQANRFAAFLKALHVSAPSHAPKNPFRGGHLQERATAIAERMKRLEDKTDFITPQIKALWEKALLAPIDTEPAWLHGDLHPRNILIENGIITAIIDWGDMTTGDIATDLASIWMLFPDKDVRHRTITEYASISDATLNRARGWAILFGVVLLDTGFVDHPRHAVMGERILQRVLEDN